MIIITMHISGVKLCRWHTETSTVSLLTFGEDECKNAKQNNMKQNSQKKTNEETDKNGRTLRFSLIQVTSMARD